MTEKFDWLLRSAMKLPPADQWRYRSLSAMLEPTSPEENSCPLLIGADHTGPLEVTLSDLRRAAARADRWRQQHGLTSGDSLLLVRLPYSSEVPLAAAAIALMSLGLRVVLPMSFDRATLKDMLQATQSRALLWCADAVSDSGNAQAREADAMCRDAAKELDLATFSLDGKQAWHLPSTGDDSDTVADREPGTTDTDREVLVLSTSGSTGRPKLARYTETALLMVAEAWHSAGLMSIEVVGGRSICPTLSHSMGFRNVLHAVWNRQPTLLAQPEWLEESPKKYIQLMERCPPQHITCGPAMLGDLGLLSQSVRRVREALSSLRYVVSSGAAEIVVAQMLSGNVRVANAFGMTELQQVLSTLIQPGPQVAGALGRPLPGVAVAVRYEDAEHQVGRLFVSAPFASRGYVGEADFGPWLETGDLVRVEGDDLVWVGRTTEDFLNTGHGVKVALAELRNSYTQLQAVAEAVLFVEVPRRGGVGAIAYVGNDKPTDAEVRARLLQAIAADNQQLATQQQDFALEYMSISVVGCVAGRPPKRGPGKIDRQGALAEWAELIAAMNDPLTDHSQVINVPAFGSDRPDWRRYASPRS
jgi:acyl-coenzyme A synthetase/AMP-(fatty) acid ligase